MFFLALLRLTFCQINVKIIKNKVIGGRKMVDIAANITEFRRRCGYTQKELAEKINVSVQTVSKWENGVSHS